MLKLLSLRFYIVSILIFTQVGVADESGDSVVQYTNLFADRFTFSDGNTTFRQHDMFSKVSVCALTANCIQFDETLLALPPSEVFSVAKKTGLSIYRIEKSESIELQVEYATLSILGENLDGFIVQTFEIIEGSIADPIGIYFFTKSKGIISFDYKYKAMSRSHGKIEVVSEQLVLSKPKGLFSN